MLALDRVYGPWEGLTVFGDHADPARFYYLPDRPRLAVRDGVPQLSFLEFVRSEDEVAGGLAGGGMLTFTAELSVDAARFERCLEALRRLGIESPVLGPAPVRSGRALLVTALVRDAGEGDPVVAEAVVGETRPDLTGDNAALFSLYLPTLEAAELVRGLFDTPGPSPFGVRYELEYLGLRPAGQVHVEADYARVRDELSWRFGVGVTYMGWSVKAAVEETTRSLVQDGAIRVEVLHFTDDADMRRRTDQALAWFQDQVLRDFFRTAFAPQERSLAERLEEVAREIGAAALSDLLTNNDLLTKAARALGISPDATRQAIQGAGNNQGNAAFSVQLGFTYTDVHEDERKLVRFDWSGAAAEPRIAAPQGLLGEMGLPAERAPFRLRGSVADGLRSVRVNVRPVGDLAAMGVQRLDVHWRYGEGEDAADGTVSFLPGEAGPATFAYWVGSAGLAYHYQVQAAFSPEAPWEGRAPVQAGAWVESTSRELLVHPLQHLPTLAVELDARSVDFTRHPDVSVELREGPDDDALGERFTLNAETPAATWRVRLPGDRPADVRARVSWSISGEWLEGDWEPVIGGALVLQAPWRGRRELRFVPLLPEDFLDASVRVRVVGDGPAREELVTFAPGERAKTLSLPTRRADGVAEVEATVVVVRADGDVFEGPPTRVEGGTVIVSDRVGPQRRVRVRLVAGDTLAAAGVSAVRVTLYDADDGTEEADRVVFTERRREPAALLVPARGDTLRYRYQVTRYGPDGAARADDPVDGTLPELIVGAAG